MRDRNEILNNLFELMNKLAQDCGYHDDIGPQTRLFADLGYGSLDLVILGTAIQDYYQQPMAFSELMADLGEREIHDLSLSELVDFIAHELDPAEQTQKEMLDE